jgi:hypothetical protein
MPDGQNTEFTPAMFNQEPCFGVLTNSILSRIDLALSGVKISYKADFLWASNCPGST